MTAIRKDVLRDYKKSNKDRRKRLVSDWGFGTEKEFLSYLQNDPESACEKGGRSKTTGTGKKRGRKPGVKNKPKEPVITKLTPATKLVEGNKPMDYVIAFDTTGSMRSYIASVRKHVVNLVENLFSNTTDLRIKIVAFGDYCDMVGVNSFGNAYQSMELTSDRQALINFVNDARNTPGGDGDEFYELVIRKINTETDWREGVEKSVLFIADAGPHQLGYSYKKIIQNNKIDWEEEAQVAKQMGIQYDTLRINPGEEWYERLSQITGGACMNFSNADKISKVVESTVYARASSASFSKVTAEAMASGDEEMMSVNRTLSKTLLKE
jgi:hypothetical protein